MATHILATATVNLPYSINGYTHLSYCYCYWRSRAIKSASGAPPCSAYPELEFQQTICKISVGGLAKSSISLLGILSL